MRPQTCTKCGDQLSNKQALRTHYAKMHPKTPLPAELISNRQRGRTSSPTPRPKAVPRPKGKAAHGEASSPCPFCASIDPTHLSALCAAAPTPHESISHLFQCSALLSVPRPNNLAQLYPNDSRLAEWVKAALDRLPSQSST